jgi:hypothetical protein
MDWTFALLFCVVVVLIMVSPMYQRSKAFHKNMFSANDVASMGVVAQIEVFAVDDTEFGPLVGLVFNGSGGDLRLSITPDDARLLALMMETAAHDAQQ